MKHAKHAVVVDSPAQRGPRHDWSATQVLDLFELPFIELLDRARAIHRETFPVGDMQISTLLSIKTGACPEDCAYCPQSVHFDTGLNPERLAPLEEVLSAARAAQAHGATRFCMGAAYRSPRPAQLKAIAEMVREVKALGLETCATLGMLTGEQARTLKDAGLDYYNHNLDTSERYYAEIITTRSYADRLDTLAQVRGAGLKVCCGGIVGMGETRADRAELLRTLANLDTHPESVPINHLVRVPGTPLADAPALDPLEFVRTVAVARILMPGSRIRLSAGRTDMSDETQALAFLAGANSIFYGDRLLTTPNPEADRDMQLLARLGIEPARAEVTQPA
ncbi:MAG: biotin synthase BioB [Gammaproteobacteria bacterium]|nr:biotin synthase BioB [Gammaproteobacteria bacterium]